MVIEKVIDFMSIRRPMMLVSGLCLLVALASLGLRGIQFGMEFTGGTLVELHYERAPSLDAVRQRLVESGYTGVSVVQFGSETELLVRMQSDGNDDESEEQTVNIGDRMVMELRDLTPGVGILVARSEIIGSQMGEELLNNGVLGMLMALVLMFLYIAVRFQSKFSVGAVTALAFNALIVLGVFSLWQLEFDQTVLAAVLAVIAYSLNDTIVVADRIRENFRILRGETSLGVINISLSQVLGRTLVTSGTTLFVLIALFFFGGELIRNFSLALMIGVVVGNFSSIYVASTVMLWLKVSKEDLMPPVKEGADEINDLP